nr:unnamed protein product [Callosobruchus chinensis]
MQHIEKEDACRANGNFFGHFVYDGFLLRVRVHQKWDQGRKGRGIRLSGMSSGRAFPEHLNPEQRRFRENLCDETLD